MTVSLTTPLGNDRTDLLSIRHPNARRFSERTRRLAGLQVLVVALLPFASVALSLSGFGDPIVILVGVMALLFAITITGVVGLSLFRSGSGIFSYAVLLSGLAWILSCEIALVISLFQYFHGSPSHSLWANGVTDALGSIGLSPSGVIIFAVICRTATDVALSLHWAALVRNWAQLVAMVHEERSGRFLATARVAFGGSVMSLPRYLFGGFYSLRYWRELDYSLLVWPTMLFWTAQLTTTTLISVVDLAGIEVPPTIRVTITWSSGILVLVAYVLVLHFAAPETIRTVRMETNPRGSLRFAVGVTFSGEHRDLIAHTAEILVDMLGRDRVFYDRFYEAELARPDLDLYLQNIYRRECELVCVFVSAGYTASPWCGLEWRAVRELLAVKGPHEVMLLRLDGHDFAGMLAIDGYLDVGSRSPQEIASRIVERWQSGFRVGEPTKRDLP